MFYKIALACFVYAMPGPIALGEQPFFPNQEANLWAGKPLFKNQQAADETLTKVGKHGSDAMRSDFCFLISTAFLRRTQIINEGSAQRYLQDVEQVSRSDTRVSMAARAAVEVCLAIEGNARNVPTIVYKVAVESSSDDRLKFTRVMGYGALGSQPIVNESLKVMFRADHSADRIVEKEVSKMLVHFAIQGFVTRDTIFEYAKAKERFSSQTTQNLLLALEEIGDNENEIKGENDSDEADAD